MNPSKQDKWWDDEEPTTPAPPPSARDDWWNDSNLNAPSPVTPPSTRDDWWNVGNSELSPNLPPAPTPPMRDDWWNDPNFNASPPSGGDVPYIGDVYPPTVGKQAFTPRLQDLPPVLSTFGRMGESQEEARRSAGLGDIRQQAAGQSISGAGSGNPLYDFANQTPLAKALRGDIGGAVESAAISANPITAALAASPEAQKAVGQALGSDVGQLTIAPMIQRLMQVPENIGKPITPEEAIDVNAQNIAAQKQAEWLGSSGDIRQQAAAQQALLREKSKYEQLAGSPAPETLKLGRAGQELVKVPLDALNEFYMQTAGRALGSFSDLAQNYPDWTLARTLDTLTSPTGIPIGKALEVAGVIRSPQAPTQERILQSVLEGRKIVEGGFKNYDDSPAQQTVLLVASFILPFTAADPLAWAGWSKLNARDVNTLNDTFNHVWKQSGKPAEASIPLIRQGKAFLETPTDKALNVAADIPIVGKLAQRTPESIAGKLSDEANLFINAVTSRANSPEEAAEITKILVKVANRDASWVKDAKKFNLAPRALTADDVANMKNVKAKVGDIVSPFESQAGNNAALVMRQVHTMYGGALETAMKTIADANVPNATAQMRRAADKASAQILGMFVNASYDVVGVKRTLTPQKAVINALTGFQTEYQGYLARWFQLNNPGRTIRDAMSMTTDVISNGMTHAIPRDFFRKKYRGGGLGLPLSIRRGLAGAGFEQEPKVVSALLKKLPLEKVVKSDLGKRLNKIVDWGYGKTRAAGYIADKGLLEGLGAFKEDLFSEIPSYHAVQYVFRNLTGGKAAVLDDSIAAVKTIRNMGKGDVIDVLNNAAGHAWHPSDIDASLKHLLGGEVFRIPDKKHADVLTKHPELRKVIDSAPAKNFKLVRDAIREERKRLLVEAGTLKEVVLPPNTDFMEGAKKIATEKLGMPAGSELDDMANDLGALRDKNRLPKERAKAWAEQVVRATPEAEQKQFLREFTELENYYKTLEGDLAQETVARRLHAKVNDDWDNYYAWAEAEWRKLRQAEVDGWNKLFDSANVKLAEDTRLPQDVVSDLTKITEDLSPEEIAWRNSPEAQKILAESTKQAAEGLNIRGQDLRTLWDYRANAPRKLKAVGTGNLVEFGDPAWTEKAIEILKRGNQNIGDLSETEIEALLRREVNRGKAAVTPPAPPKGDIPTDPNLGRVYSTPSDIAKLDLFEKDLAKNWGNMYEKATPAEAKAYKAAASEAKTRIAETRLLAEFMATVYRDRVFHNYGDKRVFDHILKGLYAYPYWYTREIAQWGRLYFENPHALFAMNTLYEQVEKANAELPDWMKKNININLGNAGLFSMPILNQIDPMANLRKDTFRDPNIAKDPLGRGYIALNDYGPGSVNGAIPLILGIGAQLAADGSKDPIKQKQYNDLAYSYASRFGVTSNVVQDLTGMAIPESIAAGLGVRGYQMMFTDTPEGKKFVGSKYDRNGLVKAVASMVDNKQISPEAVRDLLEIVNDPFNSKYQDPYYRGAWDQFNRLLEQQRANRLINKLPNGVTILGPDALTFGVGPTGRYRTQTDLDIANAQSEFAALMEKKDTLSPDEYREQMRQLFNKPDKQSYPLYTFGKKVGGELDEAYAWDVLSRIGVKRLDNGYLDAANMDRELMAQFFEAKGIPPNWTKREMDSFMNAVGILGASLAMPDLPTQAEWDVVRQRGKVMNDTLAKQFFTPRRDDWMKSGAKGYVSPETLREEYERYKYGSFSSADAHADYLKTHPELVPVLNAEAQFKLTDEVNGKKLLAAYDASDANIARFLWSRFNADHAKVQEQYNLYLEFQNLGDSDPVAKKVASEFYAKNKEAFDKYRKEKAAFGDGLDNEIAKLKATLPSPKLPALRSDVAVSDIYSKAVELANKKQKEQMELEKSGIALSAKGETVAPSVIAKQLVEKERARIEKEQTAKAKAQGYLTTANKDAYEVTLQTAIGDKWDDPRDKQRAFFQTDKRGWVVYEQMDQLSEVMDYIGGSGSLREAILTDPTSKWTAVVAYVRKLTPEQLAQMKMSINDIDVVWAKTQAYTDAPSEYARSQIVGVDVVFNLDGSISTNRQSVDKYYKGIGGFPKSDGTTSGSGSASRSTARSTSGGGSGGAPRGGSGGYSGGGYSAPRAAPVDETPALAAEWDSFASTLSGNPDLLVKLQDYFSQPENVSLVLLQRDPNLALWVSQQDPSKMARLRRAFLAWAKMRGLLGATQQAAIGQLDTPLRVYPRRSGRSGL